MASRTKDGMGRDQGIEGDSPFCKRLNKYPTSILAGFENGGVFTSPCSQTRGLSLDSMQHQYMSNPT